MRISVDDRQLKKLNGKMGRVNRNINRKLPLVMRETGEDLLKTTVRNSSGRPGPNVVTGQYISNFYVSQSRPNSVVLGNRSPQTRRLEFGFYGTDSLGRVYHQQAFPHIYPALAEVTLRLADRLEVMIQESWDQA